MPTPQKWIAAPFAALARWRSARAVHPAGVLLDGHVTVTDRESATAGALGGTGERPVVVRMSKGAGMPGGRADLLGIAVRTSLGPGEVLDVLFSSVGRHRVTRLLLAPSAGWCRHPYTTFLPYRVDGHRVIIGLDPDEPERADGTEPDAVREAVGVAPLTFSLTEQRIGGRLRRIGRLVVESVRDSDAPVSFDPVLNAHPRLRPVRPLSALRAWAYAGSRRGRGADPAGLDRGP